jgi:hypothetical protein
MHHVATAHPFCPPPPQLAPVSVLSCRECHGHMQRAMKVETNRERQLLGIFFFLIGIGLLFAFPIGTVTGLVLMAVAARLGRKDTKIWKCRRCAAVLPRG